MNTILNLSPKTFTLNGVAHLRKFFSNVKGDKVRIYNAYNVKDVLLDYTHYSEITINGMVYGSSATLQIELLEVIYLLNTDGSEAVPQDNIIISKPFVYTVSPTPANFASIINSLPSFEIHENEIYLFSGNNPTLSREYPNNYKFFIKGFGKGNYGVGGIPLTGNEIEIVFIGQPTLYDILGDPTTQTFILGDIGALTVSEYINTHTPPYNVQDQENGYRVFNVDISGINYDYIFLGDGGVYGLDQEQTLETDFKILGNESVLSPVPNLTQVLSIGDRIVKFYAPSDAPTEINLVFGDHTKHIVLGGGFITQVNIDYTIFPNTCSFKITNLGLDTSINVNGGNYGVSTLMNEQTMCVDIIDNGVSINTVSASGDNLIGLQSVIENGNTYVTDDGTVVRINLDGTLEVVNTESNDKSYVWSGYVGFETGDGKGVRLEEKGINFIKPSLNTYLHADDCTVDQQKFSLPNEPEPEIILASRKYADDVVNTMAARTLQDQGNFDASVNAFPIASDTITGLSVKKAYLWTVSVGGILPGGQAVTTGDVIRALVNTPGQTPGNWNVTENNLGYVPENNANKASTMTGNEASTVKFLTSKAIYDWAVVTFQTIITALSFGTFVNGLSPKTSLVDADYLPVMDSAAANVSKKWSWLNVKANLKTYFDTQYNAVITAVNWGAFISGLSPKSTIDDADTFAGSDSLATGTAKKFTWLTVKNSIRSFLNPFYTKTYMHVTPSVTYITGTTEQILATVVISPNDFSANDAAAILFNTEAINSGTPGTKTLRIKINSTNDLAGTPLQIATTGAITATNIVSQLYRSYCYFKTGNKINVYPPTQSAGLDSTSSALPRADIDFNLTGTVYLHLTGQLSVAADQLRCAGGYILKL